MSLLRGENGSILTSNDEGLEGSNGKSKVSSKFLVFASKLCQLGLTMEDIRVYIKPLMTNVYFGKGWCQPT